MSDTPWSGDVVGLVEAFRAGERSPSEELEATLAAVEANDLNAVCHVDAEAARVAAAAADVSLPYGGVPLAVKELLAVGGWPASLGSLPLADEVFDADGISVERLKAAGAVVRRHPATRRHQSDHQDPRSGRNWNLRRTPGGSSGGSAAGAAGGLFARHRKRCGGSIRIPAGAGLTKSTFAVFWDLVDPGNATAVEGTVSRSTRDAARYLDVTNGRPSGPRGLPRVEGCEAGLGSCADEIHHSGSPSFPTSAAPWGPETEELVAAAAEELNAPGCSAEIDLDAKIMWWKDRRCRNCICSGWLARVCTGPGRAERPDNAADTG